MADVYVEFPVDLVVDVHWHREPDHPPPAVETHPCNWPDYVVGGVFPINNAFGFSNVVAIRGVDLSDPSTPWGFPIQGTVTFGGGEIDAQVFFPGIGPPAVSGRPAWVHYGCGFDLATSTDAVSWDIVGSTSRTINEGDSGSFENLSVNVGPIPVGTTLYVGVGYHGGSRDISKIAAILQPALLSTGGFVNVTAHADLICTGPAPSEDEPFAGLTRVTL